LQATAKHSYFKDAALAAQGLAAAEEDGKTRAMMFSLLQEQYKAQLEAMAASNKQGMDMMFERMNALVAGHGKAAEKVTAPPATHITVRATSSLRRNKKKCTNCRKHVFHKSKELQAQDQCKQVLARMEIIQKHQCASLTGPGDNK
jgi:hypothetical protein